MTDWPERWPARGLLAECRRLWALVDEQRSRIAALEAEIAAGPTWVTRSGVQWRLDRHPETAPRKEIR